MKFSFLLTLFAWSFLLVDAQSYPVGTRTITYTDANRGNRSIPVELHYPAIAAGAGAALAADSFPFVIFGHGFQMTAPAYYPFADTLAQRGYIVAFANTENSFSPSHADFAKDLIFIYSQLISEDTNISSPLYQHVIARGAIAGHSMGGGCTVLSAQYGDTATCYFTMAEATTNPSSITAAKFLTKPYLSLAGAYDCIAPYATNQQPTYDSCASSCKYLINITGASHCHFGLSNTQCDIGETFSNCASLPLSRADQIATVQRYLHPFLDHYLKGSAPAQVTFDSVYAADNVNVKMSDCASSTTGVAAIESSAIHIYPNPTDGVLYIRSDEAIGTIYLSDAFGKVVMKKENVDQLDISPLATGLYMLQIAGKDGVIKTAKVVKQ